MMSMSIEDFQRLRPVDQRLVDEQIERLRDRQRAWKLRELRDRAGLTQVEIAEIMQVGQGRVSQIERGGAEGARLETLRRYAEAIGGHLSVEITVGDARYAVA